MSFLTNRLSHLRNQFVTALHPNGDVNETVQFDCLHVSTPMDILWKCPMTNCEHKCAHFWVAAMKTRYRGGGDCPYCKGWLKTPCCNVQIMYPELVADWDFMANKVYPFELTPTSATRIFWKCHVCAHAWSTFLSSRTKHKSRCPRCIRPSRLEQNMLKILEDLKLRKVIKDVVVKKRLETTRLFADFWLTLNNQSNMVIEMDGEQHSIPSVFSGGSKIERSSTTTEEFLQVQINDTRKNDWCATNGVHLLRIGYQIIVKRYLELVMDFLKSVEDAEGTFTPIFKNITYVPRIYEKGITRKPRSQDNVLLRFPELVAAEWDYERNTKKPETYSTFSRNSVFWKCVICQHSWQTAIGNRTALGTGCPRCRCPPSKAEAQMEETLKQFLKDGAIMSFDTQKRLFDSRLRCDFWVVVTHNVFMVCEMDGRQHDMAIRFISKKSSGEDQLSTIQARDQQKKDLCRSHHVHLLRITFRVKPEDYAAELRDFISAAMRLPKTETLFRRVGEA